MATTKISIPKQATVTGDVDFQDNKITSLADPTNAQDAANLRTVQSIARGLGRKASVTVATTAALSIANDTEAGDAIDGVTLADGDRILVKDQADASENGIYEVQASGGAVRADDLAASASITSSFFVKADEGTANADTDFQLVGDPPLTVDSDDLVFQNAYTSSGIDPASVKTNQALTGTKNGSNTAFTVPAAFETGTLEVFLNGLLQTPTDDYTVSGTTVTMVVAPESTEHLTASYIAS